MKKFIFDRSQNENLHIYNNIISEQVKYNSVI